MYQLSGLVPRRKPGTSVTRQRQTQKSLKFSRRPVVCSRAASRLSLPIDPKPRAASLKPSSQPIGGDLRELLKNRETPVPNLSFEEKFDEFVEQLQSIPFNQAFESFSKRLFKSSLEILWVIQKKGIFAPSKKLFIEKHTGILLNSIKETRYILTNKQRDHAMYDEATDGALVSGLSPVLVIPIAGKWVLQIARDEGKFFGEKDVDLATTLFAKLKIYGQILVDSQTALDQANQLVDCDPSTVGLCNRLKKFLKCDTIEFWCKKPNSEYVVIKDGSAAAGDRVKDEEVGAVRIVLQDRIIVNQDHVGQAPGFHKLSDGNPADAFLGVPHVDSSSQVWAGVARKSIKRGRFSIVDQSIFNVLLPFAVKVLCFAVAPPHRDKQLDHLEQRLKALLEVAEILSGVLDIDILLPTIMDRACRLLNAERCSLFLVDNTKHELVTRFHGGLDSAIRLRVGRGIVGSCAESGEIVNIRDVYADQRFDRSVDLATGFTTKSLLCIPIYNNRGEITGVTEMINKKDGLFDENDEKMLMAFNVFCGISLDNARLYKASLDLTRQLRSFIQMSVALNAADTLTSTLTEIMNNIRAIVNASRVTVFMASENNHELSEYLSIGDASTYGTIFAEEAVRNRKFVMFDEKDIFGKAQGQRLNQAIERILAAGLDADLMVFGGQEFDEEEARFEEEDQFIPDVAMPAVSRSAMTSQMDPPELIKPEKEPEEMGKGREVICCLPMLSSDTTILGVIEIACNWKVMSEDIKLLDCFSVFAGVSIERSQLKGRAKMGQVEVEMQTWISERERGMKGQIPGKLLIPIDKVSHVLSAKFDAPEWDGIGHIKVLYSIFDLFDLQNYYNITNEKLFRFLWEIRGTYNKVPYHNWRHAVDVTQFVTYEILSGGLDAILTKFEIFSIVTAAICHDANHDGFTNVYNVKAERPLGILFKNQSVMETHHCSVAIGVISKDECNIFSSLSPTDNRNMWSLIIAMILATDMAKHFDMLKEFNQIFDNNEFTLDNPQHRVMLLQLILKCADVSNVARPFDIADRWCDVLCEEFFRQGDLEKASGMEYTSALNDREHLDKPKSQIGFYTFVCLPLFEALAKAVPKLRCNVEQLLSNLDKWKEATEEKEASTQR